MSDTSRKWKAQFSSKKCAACDAEATKINKKGYWVCQRHKSAGAVKVALSRLASPDSAES